MNRTHLIGNVHLDPVWLWRGREGFSEILATFRSALDRMNEFPDFTFTSASARADGASWAAGISSPTATPPAARASRATH